MAVGSQLKALGFNKPPDAPTESNQKTTYQYHNDNNTSTLKIVLNANKTISSVTLEFKDGVTIQGKGSDIIKGVTRIETTSTGTYLSVRGQSEPQRLSYRLEGQDNTALAEGA